jgi:hypothetical protein
MKIVNSLDDLNIPDEFDSLYISFGSKFNNEFIFILDKPKQWSNAIEQMIPIFIREKEDQTVLIICLDTFSPMELDINIEKIKEISHIKCDPHFILYNTDATIQSIEVFLSYMIPYIQKIDPENVMIANYICYISPNHIEHLMEEKTPKVIYNMLCKMEEEGERGRYKTRFFQWLGYQNTNLIYNYHHYRFMPGYSNILYLLNSILEDEPLNTNNLYRIVENPSVYLNSFLSNVIDITCPIELSLYDYQYQFC